MLLLWFQYIVINSNSSFLRQLRPTTGHDPAPLVVCQHVFKNPQNLQASLRGPQRGCRETGSLRLIKFFANLICRFHVTKLLPIRQTTDSLYRDSDCERIWRSLIGKTRRRPQLLRVVPPVLPTLRFRAATTSARCCQPDLPLDLSTALTPLTRGVQRANAPTRANSDWSLLSHSSTSAFGYFPTHKPTGGAGAGAGGAARTPRSASSGKGNRGSMPPPPSSHSASA